VGPVRGVGRLDRRSILSLQRTVGNMAVNRLLLRQADDVRVPDQLCGAGDIGGQVYMCCHPNPYPHFPQCGEVRQRTFDDCWEKSSKDDRALENCSGLVNFAVCQCLERHRHGLCSCGGLV
jgi:hypothetical protein